MGRTLKLEPKWIEARKKWEISISPALSPTGARRREYFDTKATAQERIDGLKQLEQSSSQAVREAGVELIQIAVEHDFIFRDLYGLEGGLEQACREYQEILDRKHHQEPFGSLMTFYEQAKGADWGDSYRTSWNTFKQDVMEFWDHPESQLTADVWIKFFDDTSKAKRWGARTVNDKLSMLSSVWSHAVIQGKAKRNPIEAVGRRKVNKKEVAVYSVSQVQKLMNCAWEHDREMVPFFSLLVFAGLRPDQRSSEIKNIEWEDVNFEERWIRVARNFDNKTQTKRFVKMEDNLHAWLLPWRGSKGRIMPPNVVKRRRYITRGKYQSPSSTPEKDWSELVPYGLNVRDITRHTYGSYLEAKYRDRNIVKENMGHTDFTTYEQHYRNARSPTEAEAFWSIYPPTHSKGE